MNRKNVLWKVIWKAHVSFCHKLTFTECQQHVANKVRHTAFQLECSGRHRNCEAQWSSWSYAEKQEHIERLNLKSVSAIWKIFAENLEQFQFLGHWSHVWDTEVFCFDYFLTCIGVRKTRRSIMFKHIRMIKQLGLEQRMLAETPQPNTFVYTVD